MSDRGPQSQRPIHVRFAPKADKQTIVSACPLCAMSGCEQSQQASPYSITSSALASSLDGTVRPSARAVLRLINR
jgi:hypothetical protein